MPATGGKNEAEREKEREDFVVFEQEGGGSADIWGLIHIHEDDRDWTIVLRACWDSFQAAWLLGRVPRSYGSIPDPDSFIR